MWPSGARWAVTASYGPLRAFYGHPLAPLSPADVAVWGLALDRIRADVTPANADLVARLEPLGRAGDGGLRLRAPPGQQLGRFSRLVAVALTGAGDAAGGHAAIVET